MNIRYDTHLNERDEGSRLDQHEHDLNRTATLQWRTLG